MLTQQEGFTLFFYRDSGKFQSIYANAMHTVYGDSKSLPKISGRQLFISLASLIAQLLKCFSQYAQVM